MNINTWNRRALSLCLMVAVFATYSINTLATSPKVAGEIIVSGKSLGENTSVLVNGSSIESGSSLFSSSKIVTPENADAVVNFGKIGRIQIAPSTDLKLNFDDASFGGILSKGKATILTASQSENVETIFSVGNMGTLKLAPNTSVALTVSDNGVSAQLLAGAITAVNSTGNIAVTTPNGKTVNLTSGNTVNAQGGGGGGNAWLWWALIFGGAAAGIIIAATSNNNRIALGSGGTVVSPNR